MPLLTVAVLPTKTYRHISEPFCRIEEFVGFNAICCYLLCVLSEVEDFQRGFQSKALRECLNLNRF